MTVNSDDLKRRFWQALYRGQFAGLQEAEIGIIDGEGNRIVKAHGRPGAVWVRIIRGSQIVPTTALNIARGVSLSYGVKVWVGENAEGKLAIMGLREAAMVAEIGESAAALAQPNAATSTLILARQLKMGRVRPDSGLFAYIEPIHHAGGYWPGGVINLADYVPYTAGFHRWVKVGINEGTNQAIAYPGDLVAKALPLTETLLANVPFPVGVAYAGVKLEYGMTAIDKESLFADCTPWRSTSGGGAGGGSTFLAMTDTPAAYSAPGDLVVVNATKTGLEFISLDGEGIWDPNLPPASPSSWDDEFNDSAVDGKWTENDPSNKLAVTESGTIITLELAQDNGAGAGLWQDAPAGDWQVVVKVKIYNNGDFPSTYATDTKIGIAAQFSDGGVCTLAHGHWFPNDPPPFMKKPSVKLLALGGGYTIAQFIDATEFYLRLRYNSSTKDFSGQYSVDGGVTWLEKIVNYGVAVTKIGLYAENQSKPTENHVVKADFDFFRVREAYGNASDPIHGNTDEPLVINATHVSYTPAAGGDWNDPGPTTVQDALDALASSASAQASHLDEYTDDVSNPPTDAELDAAIGTPADVGAGYAALLDDGGAGSAVYLVTSDGTNWWYTTMTKAT